MGIKHDPILINNPSVLIAGANGIIGRYLFKSLSKNYPMFGISKTKNISEDLICHVDLTKKSEVRSFLQTNLQIDVLIFLVGLAHSKGKKKEYKSFDSVNYKTLENFLKILKEKNKLPKKIIFSSTISVYGESLMKEKYDETSETNPTSPYAVTKLKSERYLLKNYINKTWILRFAPVYSPNFNLNIERRTKLGFIGYRVGNGEFKLSLCSIYNIEKTIKAILQNKIPPGVYNLSDNEEYSYNKLLTAQKINFVINIPLFLIKVFGLIGKKLGNIFLQENTIKLVSNNIYTSHKIQKYITLTSNLNSK